MNKVVKKVCFFHVGESIDIPSMMVESLKLAYSGTSQGVEVIQVSPLSTPRVEGVSHFLVVPEVQQHELMMARIHGYLKSSESFVSDVAYVDTDMLFVRPIEVPSYGIDSAVLCRRNWTGELNSGVRTPGGVIEFPEYEGKDLASTMPFLACFVVASGDSFWRQCWGLAQELDERHRRWYGDQIVLREASMFIRPVYVYEWSHACLPEFTEQVDRSQVVAMHYKGKRKAKMSKHLDMLKAL